MDIIRKIEQNRANVICGGGKKSCRDKKKYEIESNFSFDPMIYVQPTMLHDKPEDATQGKVVAKQEEGYVYFIYAPDLHSMGHKHVKIGMTANINSRMAQLQTGNSFLLKIHVLLKDKDYVKLESNLHDVFRDRRLIGEWFIIELFEIDQKINALGIAPKIVKL